MANGDTLSSDGTTIQRLDRIEGKLTEVGSRADGAVTAAREAALAAREAVASSSEVNRQAAASFRSSAAALAEVSTVLFGSKLIPDGGEIGRINEKLDGIAAATTAKVMEKRTTRVNRIQYLLMAGGIVAALTIGVVNILINFLSHGHL
jgi:hypothetical protein